MYIITMISLLWKICSNYVLFNVGISHSSNSHPSYAPPPYSTISKGILSYLEVHDSYLDLAFIKDLFRNLVIVCFNGIQLFLPCHLNLPLITKPVFLVRDSFGWHGRNNIKFSNFFLCVYSKHIHHKFRLPQKHQSHPQPINQIMVLK